MGVGIKELLIAPSNYPEHWNSSYSQNTLDTAGSILDTKIGLIEPSNYTLSVEFAVSDKHDRYFGGVSRR